MPQPTLAEIMRELEATFDETMTEDQKRDACAEAFRDYVVGQLVGTGVFREVTSEDDPAVTTQPDRQTDHRRATDR
jgi:hypothetical protein